MTNLTLREFIAGLKRVYGGVNVTVTNVEEINVLTVSTVLLEIDAKLVATDGVLSSHKTEQYEDDDNLLMKSSVNVRKATWVAVASIGLVEDKKDEDGINDIVINVAVSIVGGKSLDEVYDIKSKNIMRI